MMNFIRNHRVLSIIIFLNIIAIIVVTIIGINQASKTATIDIQVAPNDVTITLNGKKYENNESYNLKPGTYEAIISMDDMTTKTETLEISDGAFVRLHTYLLDENGSFDYYKSHQDDFSLLEQVADKSDTLAQEFITKYNQLKSIEDILPIYKIYYDGQDYIEYYLELSDEYCPEIVCINIIDSTGGNKQNAYQIIEDSGYNPEDFQINYTYNPIESLE